MAFNQYCLYSYTANDFKNICDDKILTDLHILKSLKEYDDVNEYVNKVFGYFDDKQKLFDYPNNIQVIVLKEEGTIAVGAIQNAQQIFGLSWTLN